MTWITGNDPRAQDYGQACDDAANRALRRLETLSPLDRLKAALELAGAGGLNVNDTLDDLIERVTATEAFGEGALKEGW